MRRGWIDQPFLAIEGTVTEQSAQLVGPPKHLGEPRSGYLTGFDRRTLSQQTRNLDKTGVCRLSASMRESSVDPACPVLRMERQGLAMMSFAPRRDFSAAQRIPDLSQK